jgi:hypothetical protein
MEQTTLKYLRVLIPGIACYLGAFPFVKYYFGDAYHIESLDFAYVTVFSLLAGAVYYQINLQCLAMYPSHLLINKNILKRLIAIYGKRITPSQKTYLTSNQRYLHVFYRLIDSDESLKKKSYNVYFNGIFWTSSIDLFIVCMIFWLLYRFVFPQVTDASLFSDVFLTLAVLSIILHVLSVRKHISLSNDQLSYIESFKREEVMTDFSQILQQVRQTDKSKG